MPEHDGYSKETDYLNPLPPAVIQSPTSPPNPVFASIRSLWHLFAFFVMEFSFVALAWYCFAHPLTLPFADPSDLATLKSGFTALFVVWHTVAVAIGSTSCLITFSREWAVREPQTDTVSTVTSSITTHILYFFRVRATKTFRVALSVFLGLMALRTTGSSTIVVMPVPRPGIVPVRNLNMSEVDHRYSSPRFIPSFGAQLRQANLVARLEIMNNVTTGHRAQSNTLIPLPSLNAGDNTQTLEYVTDIVSFNYACQWRTPNVTAIRGVNITGDDWQWVSVDLIPGYNSSLREFSTIVQLLPNGPSINLASGSAVFLITGGNSSYPLLILDQLDGKSLPWVDLANLPTTNNFTISPVYVNDPTRRIAPLATLLICDPQLSLNTSVTVRLSPTVNPTAFDITVLAPSSSARIGNIDRNTTEAVFTLLLSQAFAGLSVETAGIDPFVGRMFLVNGTRLPLSRFDDTSSRAFPLLDVRQIEENLNRATLSALNAFTNGYIGASGELGFQGSIPDSVNVTGRYENAGVALGTNAPFVIAHSALFTLVAVALATLGYLNNTQRRVPFDLANVRKDSRPKILD